MSELSQAALVALSKWVDARNVGRDPEAQMWGRISKINEEAGEAIAAFIGVTGQNPRKGVTHEMADVIGELYDVIITALGAIEHLEGHPSTSLAQLDRHIIIVARRAGVIT